MKAKSAWKYGDLIERYPMGSGIKFSLSGVARYIETINQFVNNEITKEQYISNLRFLQDCWERKAESCRHQTIRFIYRLLLNDLNVNLKDIIKE